MKNFSEEQVEDGITRKAKAVLSYDDGEFDGLAKESVTKNTNGKLEDSSKKEYSYNKQESKWEKVAKEAEEADKTDKAE